jgi:hypothetical protein
MVRCNGRWLKSCGVRCHFRDGLSEPCDMYKYTSYASYLARLLHPWNLVSNVCMRLILFAFVMFCCNTWLSSIVMYPCNGRCLNSCGTKTFSILDFPRSPMDICEHCASSTCGQKRIVLDLLENLKTITVSFHCTCHDFPSCIMHKIIYLIVGFLQF